MSDPHGFHCRRCGAWHDELPLSYAADAPALWYQLAEEERAQRAVLTSDQCVIDGRYFFLRGCVELPGVDGAGPFVWGAWVSVSEPSFAHITERWTTPGREHDPPCFGWFNTELPGYPTTLSLKTMVHQRPVGERPWIDLEPTDHPLAVEQRSGITLARIREIAEVVLHGEP